MPDSTLLAGRLALVTGAASGIGRAIALAFAREGADVIATDLDASACTGTVESVRAAGRRGWAFALDVADGEAAAALADRVAREAGHVDILVNSAGVLVREGIDSSRALAIMRQVTDVNLVGTFNVIHAFLPALRRTRGCIINIASGAAFVAQTGCVGYSASKGGVKMLTQTMAADLAPDGIRVNALAPGVIDTPMTAATRSDPQRLQNFLQRIPLARVGQPEEIAGPAVFLASSLASYVTGVTLPVDGGRVAV
jgi:NAD(P)-dependent dehydrogenase (short-subunit alcohol dehydrogenase family)